MQTTQDAEKFLYHYGDIVRQYKNQEEHIKELFAKKYEVMDSLLRAPKLDNTPVLYVRSVPGSACGHNAHAGDYQGNQRIGKQRADFDEGWVPRFTGHRPIERKRQLRHNGIWK